MYKLSDIFGPVILNANHLLPGTPMIADSVSNHSKSMANSFNDRLSLLNASMDESLHSTSMKVVDIESLQPGSLERKISYKRKRRFHDNNGTIKEVSPDSGQGDESSLTISNIDDFNSNSADRRESKQDQELRDDPESLFFRDGRRKIDMVLCFVEEFDGVMTETDARHRDRRKTFHENLIREGLDIEIEDKSQSFDEKTYFVKIHLPWRTESRYAELMNLRLPVKRFITISVKQNDDENNAIMRHKSMRKAVEVLKYFWSQFRSIYNALTEYDYALIEREPSFYSATAGGKPEEQFIIKDRMTNYNCAQRSLMVFQILLRFARTFLLHIFSSILTLSLSLSRPNRARYDDGERVGIRRLLNDGTYQSCFPLHEGRYDKAHQNGTMLDRRVRGVRAGSRRQQD